VGPKRWGQTSARFANEKSRRGAGLATRCRIGNAAGRLLFSTWLLVEEVKEKILEQKFPCAMSGWTTGLSGLLA